MGMHPTIWQNGETHANDEPNEETLAAIREVEEMKKDPTIGKSYDDVDEMMRELLA